MPVDGREAGAEVDEGTDVAFVTSKGGAAGAVHVAVRIDLAVVFLHHRRHPAAPAPC